MTHHHHHSPANSVHLQPIHTRSKSDHGEQHGEPHETKNIHYHLLKFNNQQHQQLGLEHALREMIKWMKVIAEETKDAELLRLLDSQGDLSQALIELGLCIHQSIPASLFQKEPYNALAWPCVIYLASKAGSTQENHNHFNRFLRSKEIKAELDLILTYFCELERVESSRLETVPYQTTFSRLEIPLIEAEVERYLQEDYSLLALEFWNLFQNDLKLYDDKEDDEEGPTFVKEDLSLKLSLLFLFDTFGKLSDRICLHGFPYAIQVFFEEMQQFLHSEHRREVMDSWLWNPQDHTLYHYYEREGEEIGIILKQLLEFVGGHHHRRELPRYHHSHSSYSENEEKEKTLLNYLHKMQSSEEKKNHLKVALKPEEELLQVLEKLKTVVWKMQALIGVPEFVTFNNSSPLSSPTATALNLNLNLNLTMKQLQVNFLYDQYIPFYLHQIRELGKRLPSFPFHELLTKYDLMSSSLNHLTTTEVHDLDYLSSHLIDGQKAKSTKNFNFESTSTTSPYINSFWFIEQRYYAHRYQQIIKLLPSNNNQVETDGISVNTVIPVPSPHHAKGYHQKSLNEVINCIEHHVRQLHA